MRCPVASNSASPWRAPLPIAQLILADEPTGELDSKTGREMMNLFRTIVREKNVTMLMATHDSIVDDHVDKVLHLRDGRDRYRGGVRTPSPEPETDAARTPA